MAGRAVDGRRPEERPDDDRHARRSSSKTDRTPHRWQFGANYTYFTELFGKNHELKTGYMGWRATTRPRTSAIRISSSTVIAATTAMRAATKRRTGMAASRVRIRCCSTTIPNITDVRRVVPLGLHQRQDHAEPAVDAERRPALRPLLELPARAGQPGHRPVRRPRTSSLQGRSNYPVYSTFVPRVSAVYDVTGEGRMALRGSYGRYVGGSSGASAIPVPAPTTSTRTRSSRAPTPAGTAAFRSCRCQPNLRLTVTGGGAAADHRPGPEGTLRR